jgi:hypothetical protein
LAGEISSETLRTDQLRIDGGSGLVHETKENKPNYISISQPTDKPRYQYNIDDTHKNGK